MVILFNVKKLPCESFYLAWWVKHIWPQLMFKNATIRDLLYFFAQRWRKLFFIINDGANKLGAYAKLPSKLTLVSSNLYSLFQTIHLHIPQKIKLIVYKSSLNS